MSNNYLARVEQVAGNDPDAMAAAKALLQHANPEGRLDADPAQIISDATGGRIRVDDPFNRHPITETYSRRSEKMGPGPSKMRRHYTQLDFTEALPVQTVPVKEPAAVPEPVKVKAEPRKTKAASKPPAVVATGLETRKPVNQNEHTVAIINSNKLSSMAKLAAFVASAELGMKAGRQRKPFADIEHPMAPEWLAGKMGVSESTARKRMREATEAGFFVRLDDGKGGRKGESDSARYRATLPTYMEPWGANPTGVDFTP